MYKMANSRSGASTVNTHTLDNAQGEIKTKMKRTLKVRLGEHKQELRRGDPNNGNGLVKSYITSIVRYTYKER